MFISSGSTILRKNVRVGEIIQKLFLASSKISCAIALQLRQVDDSAIEVDRVTYTEFIGYGWSAILGVISLRARAASYPPSQGTNILQTLVLIFLTVSPALLHDGVKIGWTMERLLQTKAVGFIDGLEDLLTQKEKRRLMLVFYTSKRRLLLVLYTSKMLTGPEVAALITFKVIKN